MTERRKLRFVLCIPTADPYGKNSGFMICGTLRLRSYMV